MKASNKLQGVMLSLLLPAGFMSLAVLADGRAGSAAAGPSLTVYPDNLALVRRELDRALAPGSHTVRIEGLPANLDRSSLIVLNRGVTLIGAHGFRTYQDAASGPGASVDVELEVERPVETLRIAFLTSGLSWSADYAMVVARNDATARLDGYANVMNNSGTAYEAAEFQLLAGQIQRGASPRYRANAALMSAARELDQVQGALALQGAAFGDYHLYTVSAPLSLRMGEARRIRLVGAASAETEKLYTFSHSINYRQQYPEPMTQPVVVSYRVLRPDDSELGGVPLPAGQVRVYQEDDSGRLQLLGISPIANTPKGKDLLITIGYAFDIVGTRTQVDYSRPGGNVYESAWKVELRNASDEDATVQVVERLSGDWTIVESSHTPEKLSAGAVRFQLDVPAGGVATLEYKVSVRP